MAVAPLVLGFDSAQSYCAGMLMRGTQVLSERHEVMTKGQAERLMPMLEEMLVEAECTWPDIDRLGVGVGPGNFTGIRLAVSAARGLALALKRPAIGVSLFDAAALGADPPVACVFNARRGRAFLQVFGTGAVPDMAPCEIDLSDPPKSLLGQGLACIGTAADDLAEQIGGRAMRAAFAPASAIARLAGQRIPGARPAPLYVRAADAAPSKHKAPTILTS